MQCGIEKVASFVTTAGFSNTSLLILEFYPLLHKIWWNAGINSFDCVHLGFIIL